MHVLNKICWPFLAAFLVDDLSEPVETKHQQVHQGNNHEFEAKQPQNPEPGRFEPIHVRVYNALVGQTVDHVEEEGEDKQEGHGLVDVEESGFLGAFPCFQVSLYTSGICLDSDQSVDVLVMLVMLYRTHTTCKYQGVSTKPPGTGTSRVCFLMNTQRVTTQSLTAPTVRTVQTQLDRQKDQGSEQGARSMWSLVWDQDQVQGVKYENKYLSVI